MAEKEKAEDVESGKKEEKAEKEAEKKKDEAVQEKKEPVKSGGKKMFGKACENDAKVSLKSSKIVCNLVRGRKVSQSKRMLEEMIDEKRSIRGKYYTKTAKKILEILKSAESNAVANNLDKERLFVYTIKANKGRTFFRPRSLLRRRGERAKMTNLEIIVGEK